MQNNQNPEIKNQDISRNRFATDPVKAGTSQKVDEEEIASPSVSEDGRLPKDQQTTLNTSGVQEGESAEEDETQGEQKRRSA